MSTLKIAVVGGGPSGLCAAKHTLDYKFDVTVYEQTSKIGGTWVYTDQVGEDEYAIPIHTSMYKGLRTNLPIESMGFPEYPFQNKGKSFVLHEEVLEFFESYASEFKLNDVIKFNHHVVRVRPVNESKWEVIVKNLVSNSYDVQIFDAIFVCNGHYNKPYFPNIDGQKHYKGRIIHSHDYRRPEIFKDENVLIIGAGPSGKDILYEIATKATRVTISHHRDMSKNIFPENVAQQGDVKQFTETGAIFEDGKEETFASILFCTGYQFSFPFIAADSGICMNDSFYIQPLFKHLININYPTMAIVGLQICAYTYMYDMQVRLCLKYWSGEKSLPTKSEMTEDTNRDMKKQWDKGIKTRQAHLLGVDQNDYFYQLAEVGDLENIPEVLFKIYDDCTDLRITHPNDYREYVYKIIDNKTFTRSLLQNSQIASGN